VDAAVDAARRGDAKRCARKLNKCTAIADLSVVPFDGSALMAAAAVPDVRWWTEPVNGIQRYAQFLDQNSLPEPRLTGAAELVRAWLADTLRRHPRHGACLPTDAHQGSASQLASSRTVGTQTRHAPIIHSDVPLSAMSTPATSAHIEISLKVLSRVWRDFLADCVSSRG
jgi:hypothetical protein